MKSIKFIVMILDITLLLIVTAVFVLNFYSNNLIEKLEFSLINYINQNWAQSPVVDILLDQNCDSSQGYQQLTFGQFAGFVSGSKCSSSVRTGAVKGCSRIEGMPASDFLLWANSSFCLKRTSKSYLDHTITDNGICPNGMTVCGVLDSLNNTLCVMAGQQCPISNITIDQVGMQGFTVKLLKNGYSLSYSNTSNGIVFTNMVLSENIPCSDPIFTNRISASYPLDVSFGRDKCMRAIGNSLIDRTYKLIDSVNSADVYKQNGVYNQISLYPFFNSNTYFSQNLRLYYKNYIGLNKKCFDEVVSKGIYPRIKQGINVYSDQLDKMKSIFKAIFILVIVFFSLFCLFFFFAVIYYFCAREEPIAEKIFFFLRKSYDLTNVVFSVLVLVLYLVFYGKYLMNIQDNLSDLFALKDCGNPLINDTVYITNASFDNLRGFIIPCFILMIFGLIISSVLLAVLVNYWYKDLNKMRTGIDGDVPAIRAPRHE